MAVLDVKHEETASLLEELPGEGHLCVTGNAGVEEDVRSFAEKEGGTTCVRSDFYKKIRASAHRLL